MPLTSKPKHALNCINQVGMMIAIEPAIGDVRSIHIRKRFSEKVITLLIRMPTSDLGGAND